MFAHGVAISTIGISSKIGTASPNGFPLLSIFLAAVPSPGSLHGWAGLSCRIATYIIGRFADKIWGPFALP